MKVLYTHPEGFTVTHDGDKHLIIIDDMGLEIHLPIGSLGLREVGQKLLALGAELEASVTPDEMLEWSAMGWCGPAFEEALAPITLSVNGRKVSLRVSLKDPDGNTATALDVVHEASRRMEQAGYSVEVLHAI